MNLRDATHKLEDSIIVISGPALAVSGIIAGVDLLTGGHMLQQVSWLALAWAICLLLTLDFQVLALGARAHKIYLSDRANRRKVFEVVLAVAVAAAISYVSVQMQSIIARANSASIDIGTATVQLGINPIWLIWERSALVLVLIFLSGWFRDHEGEQRREQPTNTSHEQAINQLAEQVQQLVLSVTQITTTVTEVKTLLPERTGASEQAMIIDAEGEQGEQDTNTGERIRAALALNTSLSDRELAAMVGCSASTANKWKRRIQQAA